MTENNLYRLVEGAYTGTWDPPPLSEWIEENMGRHAFANLWEAYAGGTVFDLYSRDEHARHAYAQARGVLRMLHAEDGVIVRPDRIRFPSGGELVFVSAIRSFEQSLRGTRPTRIDGGQFLSRDHVDFFRSRGVEVI